MKNNILSMALLISSAAILNNAGFSQQYEVIDLTSGTGNAVNEGGWLAGVDSASNAYVWEESTSTFTNLGALTPGLPATYARSVNGLGQTLFNGWPTLNGAPEAWHYSPITGSAVSLLLGGNAGAWGNCILDSGLIAGNVNPINNSSSFGAFWNSSTSAPTVISGANGFTSVNAARDFVGSQDSATPFVQNACLYRDSTSTLFSLPTYNGLGNSSANAINTAGSIVGASGQAAAIWTETATGVFGVELLEGLDAVGQHGRTAYDNNDWGMAVGFLDSTRPAHNGNFQAFVYSNAYPTGNQMRHLEDFIVSGPKVDFEVANAIDGRGWITGTGRVWTGSSWASDRTLVARPLLSMLPPTPGTAGSVNDFLTFGATPNTTIRLAYSLDPNGTTSLNPWCPGLSLDMANAQMIATGLSDANGVIEFSVTIPPAAVGLTAYTQAVDIANCKKSNLVGHTFL